MTDWTRIKEIGSGIVDFRLMIEGWPHEWVTNYRITHSTNAAGRLVYPGLQYKGLQFSEQSVMREGWPSCSGLTVTITPTDGTEDTLYGFTRDARPVGMLLGSLSASDTSWTTRPGSLNSGTYHIATETILHEGGGAIARAQWDTNGQVHSVTEEAKTNPVPIYSWPPSMEGRRAYLYVYGAGDDGAGDGTCVWRGVVARPPMMADDGISWTISIDSITTLFEQNVAGGESNEYRIRGVYHSSSCPMTLYVRVEGTSYPAADGGILRIAGFYESNAEWTSAVDTALADLVSDAASDLTALTYAINNGCPQFNAFLIDDVQFAVHVVDVIDGDTNTGSPAYLNGQPAHNGDTLSAPGSAAIVCGDSSGAFYVWGTTQKAPYGYPLPEARSLIGKPLFDVAGGLLSASVAGIGLLTRYYTDGSSTFPDNRIYLDRVEGLEVGTTLCVRNGGDSTAFMVITAIDNADTQRWIEVSVFKSDGPMYLSSDSILIIVAEYGVSSNWYLFMDALIVQAPEANLGRTPYITADDVDISTWAFIWSFYPFSSYWRRRTYNFVKPTKVRDILAPELMATGFMGRLIEDGRFSVSLLPVINPQRTTQHTLTDDEILLPAEGMCGKFPRWEAQREGLVNIVMLRLGYDPIADEYDQRFDYIVRQTTSIAEHKSGDKAKHEIAVKSTSTIVTSLFSGGSGFGFKVPTNTTDVAPSTDDVVGMVAPYLRTMAEDYAIVTISVPFTKYGVLCGDIVELTSAYVPDGLGNRGVTSKKGICVGRTWNFDPAENEMGTLTLWFPRDTGKRAGYAPLGRVTGQSNTAGNVWVLTFSTANTFNAAWSEATDGDVVKHFAVNDTVTIIQVDTTSPTKVDGTITAKPASNQITVSFGATWTPGGSSWNLRFRLETAAVDRQRAYCYIADDDGALADGSAARSFL